MQGIGHPRCGNEKARKDGEMFRGYSSRKLLLTVYLELAATWTLNA